MLTSMLARWAHAIPLANLAGPFVGAVIGYAASRRGEQLKRAERRRTVAGALSAEAARIRGALGAPGDHRVPDPIFYGLTIEPPQIHPWLERVIVDGAEISPEVVGGFMSLQRELRHFGTLLGQWREAAALAASAAGDAAAAERARALHDECIATRRMAVKVLDRLDALLLPAVGDAASGASAALRARWPAVRARLRALAVTLAEDFGLRDAPAAPPSGEPT
ncbi:MAG: hypothetical protein ACJ79S_11845 [Gemmatimonadaceae bacterium]